MLSTNRQTYALQSTDTELGLSFSTFERSYLLATFLFDSKQRTLDWISYYLCKYFKMAIGHCTALDKRQKLQVSISVNRHSSNHLYSLGMGILIFADCSRSLIFSLKRRFKLSSLLSAAFYPSIKLSRPH